MFKKLFLIVALLSGWGANSLWAWQQIPMQIINEEARDASICIFDMQGKMLKKLPVTNGEESVIVDSSEFGNGLYLYSLIVNGQEVDTKKMVISK